MFEEEFDQDTDVKEFEIWLQNGIDRGWITDPFCSTHDGDPYMTEEDAQAWEEGGDPCMVCVKLKLA